jgi:CO/xanthine dehydrogenase FAD-binding subunit
MLMTTEAYSPRTLEEALEIKAKFAGGVTIVAGGTDFMVSLKLGTPPPPRVMDITRIDGLRRIEMRGASLFIGACSTFASIMGSPLVKEKAPVLHKASFQIGARQIKNRATIGGNVATCSPAGDSLPALWVHGASVLLRSTKGERDVPVDEFNPSYRCNAMKGDEILVGILVPPLRGHYVGEFYKVGTRKAQAISKVCLACLAKMKGGACADVRLAAGSVAPTVVGLEKTAAYLKGRKTDRKVIEKARQLAMSEVTPIDDVRSTALYRRTVTGNLLARFLEDLT